MTKKLPVSESNEDIIRQLAYTMHRLKLTHYDMDHKKNTAVHFYVALKGYWLNYWTEAWNRVDHD